MTDDRHDEMSTEALFREWHASEPPFDEAAGRARFLESAARGTTATPRTTSRSLVLRQWPALAAAAAIALFAFVSWRARAPLTFTTNGTPGQTGGWLATGADHELPLTFSEGTEVVLAPSTRGRVATIDHDGAVFVLEQGELKAHVVHQASTSWRFRAGPYDVQVTGTKLDVAWSPERERFAVSVTEGAVAVHGPWIGAEQVVRAGQICEVDVASQSMRLSSLTSAAPSAPAAALTEVDASAPALDVPSASASATNSAAVPAPPAPPSWTRLEARGDYAGAYAAAKATGFASILRSASADELLRLAQVSQLAGHGDEGRDALLTCRRRFPGSEPAAVAAYELGRAAAPADAAEWFARYLAEAPHGPLAHEAADRRREALAAAGQNARTPDDGGAP